MRIDKDNIEDVLIRAIREKGAMERMEALDRQMAAKVAVSRRRRTWLTSVAAACVLLVACTDVSLRLHTRSVGYGYEFTGVSRGARSGNIENLLNDKYRLHYQEGSANIFHPDFLLTDDETHGGKKPFRTYLGPRYLGGFSDHLPVYIDLINP